MAWTLRTSSGTDPSQALLKLRKNAQPTQGDVLYAGQRQRTRILERTAKGIDVDESPFAPYSDKGPYYYYPNGSVGNSRFSDKQMKSAAKRLYSKLGKGKPGDGKMTLTRSGKGLRFESYAAFKSWMGRSGVDLRGPRAPHMLQAIVVKAGRMMFGSYGDTDVGLTEMPEPADELVIGIYGDAAERATGHNEGGRHLPRRRFFGASASDMKQMARDIYDRIALRLKS